MDAKETIIKAILNQGGSLIPDKKLVSTILETVPWTPEITIHTELTVGAMPKIYIDKNPFQEPKVEVKLGWYPLDQVNCDKIQPFQKTLDNTTMTGNIITDIKEFTSVK